MAEDINIKLTVDANQANSATESFKGKMQKLRYEMAQLQVDTDGLTKATDEQKKRFNELAQEAGKLQDALDDASQQAKNYADDYATMNTALQATQGAIGAVSAVSGAMNILGANTEGAEEAIKSMTSAMAVMQGLENVQKMLNKDSLVMKALQTAKNKLLTQSIKEQTKAQVALNVAKKGMVGIIAGAVTALGVLVYKYMSAKNEVANFNKELNKSAVDAVAPLITKVNKLSEEYTKLGDDLEAKKKFIDNNKEAFKELGVKVGSVEEAESLLVKNTEKFIKAQVARAKSEASRQKISALTTEQLDNQLEYERRFIDQQKTFVEGFVDGYSKMKIGAVEYALAQKIAYEQEQGNIDKQIKKLEELSQSYGKEADAIIAEMGLMEDSADNTDDKTTAQERLNQQLERTNLLLKIRYTDAINSATNASDKLSLSKELQYKELTNEINILEKINNTLPKNSNEYLKNSLRIKELTKQKEEVYAITEALEEEEIDYAEIVDQSYAKQLDAQKKANEERKRQEKEWSDFQIAEMQRVEEEQKKIEEDRQKIEKAKWDSASEIVSAYNSLVTASLEAELEAVGDNEEEQKKVRKKYAKAQFIGQIASIGISTAQAIMGAWASASSIPYPANLIIGGIMTALLAGTGVAQTMKARNEMNTAMKAEKGGILVGASHSQGGIMLSNGVEAEGGEAIINKRSTSMFAPILSEINSYNGYGAPLIKAQPTNTNTSSSLVTNDAIKQIVKETIAGVTAIPVIVSEHNITEAQRQVSITRERAFI